MSDFKLVSVLGQPVLQVIVDGPVISAGTNSQATGTVSFANSNGMTFGLETNGVLTGSIGGVPSPVNFSAGTHSADLGSIVFSNSNNISFGLSGATITGSVAPGGGGAALSAGTQSANTGTIVFANSNGITFGMSGSSQITATVKTDYQSSNANYLTSQSNQAVSASNGSFTFQTLNFSNANNVTFGTSAGGIVTASVAAGGTGADGYNIITVGGNTTGTLTTFASATVMLAGGNNITLSQSSNTITFNAPPTSQFAVSGNASIDSAGSTISIGANAAAVSIGGNSTSAGAGYSNVSTGTVVLMGGANITLSQNGASISISGGAGGAGPALQGSGTYTQNTGTIQFANSNNITFGLSNNGVMTASFSGGTGGADGYNIVQIGTTGTTGTSWSSNSATVFLNGSNLTVSQNNSNQIVISAPATSSLVAGANITISTAGSTISVIGATVAAQPVNFSAGTTSGNLGSVIFSNANSMSFGLDGSTITGTVSYPAQSNQTGNLYVTANSTQLSSTAGVDYRSLSFAGAGAASVGVSNGVVLVSVAGGGAAISGGANSQNTGTVNFANSNNITFGLSNNGTMTASFSTAAQTNQTGNYYVAGNTTQLSSTAAIDLRSISFAGSGAASVGVSGGSILVSVPNVVAQTNQTANLYVSANSTQLSSTAGVDLRTLSFAGAGIISMGVSQGVVVASATQSVQTGNFYVTANSTQLSSTAGIDHRSLSFAGAGGASVGVSQGVVLVSVPAAVAQTNQTGNFYVTANSTQLSSTAGIDHRSISFAGAGAASVGVSQGVVLVSVPTQTNPGASASNGSFSFQTLNFSNANNVTFGTSAGGIVTASVAAPGAAAENNWVNLLGANTAGNTTVSGSTLGFSGVNMTLSGTNNSQLVLSVPATSSLSATGNFSMSVNGNTISMGANACANSISLGNSSSAGAGYSNVSTGTMIFVASNNISFTQNGASVSMFGAAGTGTSITGNASITFDSLGLKFNGSGLAGTNTATTGANFAWTVNSSGISINGSNIAGTTTAITGGAVITMNTAGFRFDGVGLAGTSTGSAGNIGISMTHDSAGLNLSLSNSALTRLIWPPSRNLTVVSAPGNASQTIMYLPVQEFLTATRMDALVSWAGASSATAATCAFALFAYGIIYTRNASTLSSLSSGSTQTTYSYRSNNAGNTEFITGALRPISVPININMNPGEYFVGFNMVTATSSIGAATTNCAQSISMMGGNDMQTALNYAEMGVQTATSTNLLGGMGLYSAATTGVVTRVSLSAIAQTGVNLSRANIAIVFRNG